MNKFFKFIKKFLTLTKTILFFIEFNSNEKYFKPYLAFLVFQNKISMEQVPVKYRKDVKKLLKEIS